MGAAAPRSGACRAHPGTPASAALAGYRMKKGP